MKQKWKRQKSHLNPEHCSLFNRKMCVGWLCVWCRHSLASVSILLVIFSFDQLDFSTQNKNNNKSFFGLFPLSFPFTCTHTRFHIFLISHIFQSKLPASMATQNTNKCYCYYSKSWVEKWLSFGAEHSIQHKIDSNTLRIDSLAMFRTDLERIECMNLTMKT